MKFKKPSFKLKKDLPPEDYRATFGWGWRSIYIFLGISVIIYIIAMLSTPFADFFNGTVSAAIRTFFALLTSWLPFSLAEVSVILLIPALVAVMIVACRKYCGSWRNVFCFAGKIFSVVVLLISFYIWSFGVGYRCSTLDVRLDLDKRPVSAEELKNTAELLTEKVNELAGDVAFEYQSFSKMPYSLSELNDKLLKAYDSASEKYGFINKMYSRLKPVMLSELMSYTHITGFYSYFTGEANLNVVFPDYTIPYTAAHEFAHQRGIAREDEANFIAYLVCLESDDAYIRYSACLSLLEYVSSAYYRADTSDGHKDYLELRKKLDERVRYEQTAFVEFFEKYDNNVVADISGTINDTYLQLQGTQGSVSYGLVVDLAVAYFKK